MNPSFLNLIRCPFTHEDLAPCPAPILQFANREQTNGRLFNQLGLQIENPIDRALINQSETYLVIIENDIPILNQDEMIPIDHFDESEF